MDKFIGLVLVFSDELLFSAGAVSCAEGFAVLPDFCAAPFLPGAVPDGCSGADGFFDPRLEKFQRSPFSDFTRLICGWSRVISRMLSVLERISGNNSKTTFSDVACTN